MKKIKPDLPKSPYQKQPISRWVYILIVMGFLTILAYGLSPGPEKIEWKRFSQDILNKAAVERIEVVNGERAEIFIKPEFADSPEFENILKPKYGSGLRTGPHYYLLIGSVDVFEQNIKEAQAKVPMEDKVFVSYIKRENWLMSVLAWLFPIFIILVIWLYILKRTTGGQLGTGKSGPSIFNFGKSTAKLAESASSQISFEDVAGLEEAEKEVKEIIDFLKNPEMFTRLGAKIPKGVMLVGPPGTGKTLLAKAVAGEAKVPFYSISGSEFVEMFVGVGASRVRDLFRKAKEKTPCIIFIDEIDAIGRSRGKGAFMSGANDERESTLNQLLTEMDGFGTNSGVIILAATNRADILDPALLRPGRFDRHIYLELPNLSERKAIFEVHLKPLVCDQSVNSKQLAAQTPGFSGADIANICNESALIAARRKKNKISSEDFMAAIDRVVAGLEKKSKIISPMEKKTIAYHEAGHALISWILPEVDSLVKVSIIPRGKSLGAAWYLPEEKQLRTKLSMKQQLSALLGGRAAEEIIFHQVTSGALDDLEKATKLAYMMVMYYGFNEQIGNVSFYDSTGQQESTFHKPYSEETGKLIDQEVRKLIDECYQQSKSILVEHIKALRDIANFLLEKETIYRDDLISILGNRP